MDRSRSLPVMSPGDHGPERYPHPRRPSVRIVKRRSPSRMAVLSLVLAASAGAVAFAAWRWWSPAPVVAARVRTVQDIDLPWRCDAGHTFIARGQAGDRPCAMCDKPAYPQAVFDCPKHGPTEAAVRFEDGRDGNPYPSQLRFQEGPWIPMSDAPPCPICGAAMPRLPSEARDAPAAGKKRGGG